MATDLSDVSNSDLSAALQARQLAAVQPLQAALTALTAAVKTAQASMAGISGTRSSKLLGNVSYGVGTWLSEANACVAELTPPAQAQSGSSGSPPAQAS